MAFANGVHHTEVQISDGRQILRQSEKGMQHLASLTDPFPSAQKLADMWWLDMPRLVLNGWMGQQGVFTPLIEGFRAKGFDFKVENISQQRSGHTFSYDLVTISRPKSQIPTQGVAITVIKFDHDRNLPVNIMIDAKAPDQAPIVIRWAGGWKFKETFEDKTFSKFL